MRGPKITCKILVKGKLRRKSHNITCVYHQHLPDIRSKCKEPVYCLPISLSERGMGMLGPVPAHLLNVPDWRHDGRCGPNFKLDDGRDGQCDPNAWADQKGPCCSATGWCGKSGGHCDCGAKCTDYRVQGVTQSSRLRHLALAVLSQHIYLMFQT